jgi:hypothetical protein
MVNIGKPSRPDFSKAHFSPQKGQAQAAPEISGRHGAQVGGALQHGAAQRIALQGRLSQCQESAFGGEGDLPCKGLGETRGRSSTIKLHRLNSRNM